MDIIDKTMALNPSGHEPDPCAPCSRIASAPFRTNYYSDYFFPSVVTSLHVDYGTVHSTETLPACIAEVRRAKRRVMIIGSTVSSIKSFDKIHEYHNGMVPASAHLDLFIHTNTMGHLQEFENDFFAIFSRLKETVRRVWMSLETLLGRSETQRSRLPQSTRRPRLSLPLYPLPGSLPVESSRVLQYSRSTNERNRRRPD
jgi:hypothetical protein